MGVDYGIQLQCPPKEALGDDLLGLVKLRSRARVLRAVAGDEEAAAARVRDVRREGTETEEREVTLDELERAAAPLAEHAPACADCPANLLDDSYGCVGSIPYPISSQGEAWLLERLPARVDEPPGALLLKALRDFGLDGQRGSMMRAQGLLEATQAQGARWGEVIVSSDQLLEYLFFCEQGTAVTRLTLLSFGAVAVPEQPEELWAIVRGERPLPPYELAGTEGDPTVAALVRFFAAMHRAASLGTSVWVAP